LQIHGKPTQLAQHEYILVFKAGHLNLNNLAFRKSPHQRSTYWAQKLKAGIKLLSKAIIASSAQILKENCFFANFFSSFFSSSLFPKDYIS